MSEIISFKERVKNEAIANAIVYKRVFVDYEYLICSKAFTNGYKIVKAEGNNYLHLLGVNSKLSASEFWEKCILGTLEESDFDFIKSGQDEKMVKGSVRQKMQVLNLIGSMFEVGLFAEENFRKNRVECAFATGDKAFTLGFAVTGRPKSLMKSYELSDRAKPVELIFRKKRNCVGKYNEFCYGEQEKIDDYLIWIRDLILW